ncbi:MAG: hypothetical protein HRT58_22060 [Crocinitomicaceae bacterium]|nr:hypothetical protein [Flavobacteriales bacterium]NQZ38361.1 hypothetical protein [Crocinitomicaceae bacterium]PHR26313.1 MAG: hypothetical protein COA38_15115 [Fluviicola sp.]
MTFFDQYSYKQKNIALLVLGVLLAAVSYKRAFSVTMETSEYKTELQEKLILAESSDQQIRTKQIEIAQLNRLIGKEGNTIEKVQQEFLNFFAKKGQHISVHQIEEVLHFQHPDFSINTHRIVLRGDYINTLRFIYDLEKKFDLAKILNISFEFRKFDSDDEKDLYTTLLIQNYLR